VIFINMELLISNKIKSIRNILGYTQESFGDIFGITRASMAQIEIGKQNAPVNLIVGIVNNYNIPYEYFFTDNQNLITFVNDELKNHKKVTTNTHIALEPEVKYNSKNELALIPVEAVAGFTNGDVSVMEYDIQNFYKIPEFKGRADFLIRVTGHSMAPKYYNGDILACKRIEELHFVQWGKVYVMDTQQGPLVKRLYPHDTKEDILICHSDNTAMYPRFDMPKADIRSISIVIGAIRFE
jgi:repressor LexA